MSITDCKDDIFFIAKTFKMRKNWFNAVKPIMRIDLLEEESCG